MKKRQQYIFVMVPSEFCSFENQEGQLSLSKCDRKKWIIYV